MFLDFLIIVNSTEIIQNSIINISSISVQPLNSSSLLTLTNATVESIYAYIYFTNINASCINPASMPEKIDYKLRMQEYEIDIDMKRN